MRAKRVRAKRVRAKENESRIEREQKSGMVKGCYFESEREHSFIIGFGRRSIINKGNW